MTGMRGAGSLWLALGLWSGWVMASDGGDLASLENQFLAACQIQVDEPHRARVQELDAKYGVALEKALQAASQGARLEEALAIRKEMDRVRAGLPLPETDEGVEPVLGKYRAAYREQREALEMARGKALEPLLSRYEEDLVALQQTLTKAGKLDEAGAVKTYREGGAGWRLVGVAAPPAGGGRPGTAAGAVLPERFLEALVVYLSFEPGAEDGNGPGGEAQIKGTTAVEGVVGTARAFQSKDDMVTLPRKPGLEQGNAVTLAAWIRAEAVQPSAFPRIIDNFVHTKRRGYLLELSRRSGNIQFSGFPQGAEKSSAVTNEVSLLDGRWHHVAGTFDGKELRIFVDGKGKGRKPLTGPFASSGKAMTAGCGFDGNAWFPFHGAIDEVAVFNRALAPGEIERIYDLGRNGRRLR